jgi:hypothetical protein
MALLSPYGLAPVELRAAIRNWNSYFRVDRKPPPLTVADVPLTVAQVR